MIKVNKVNLKVINQEKELGNSILSFKLSGPNVDYIVANTLRRTIMADVPTYAFNDFKFEKNTSVFHNNYLKLRLRHMPVWSIENDIDFIDYNVKNANLITDTTVEDFEVTNDGDNVELDVEKNLNSSTLKQLTMYINHKNKSNDIVTVSTADAKFYYEEKQIPSPYKVAIPIVKLQPGQEIAFSAITKLGTEQEDAMYTAVCVCSYKQVNDNEFDFTIESRGQIPEKRIIQVGLINIERRIRNFLKLLLDDKKSDNKIKTEEENKTGLLIVNNEDHTLGNLISRGMQQHSKIKFAGYNLPHPVAKKVHFHYKLDKGGNVKDVIQDVVNYYSEIYSQIKKLVDSI
jgi:DNA-directed RNA polymerase subunit L